MESDEKSNINIENISFYKQLFIDNKVIIVFGNEGKGVSNEII